MERLVTCNVSRQRRKEMLLFGESSHSRNLINASQQDLNEKPCFLVHTDLDPSYFSLLSGAFILLLRFSQRSTAVGGDTKHTYHQRTPSQQDVNLLNFAEGRKIRKHGKRAFYVSHHRGQRKVGAISSVKAFYSKTMIYLAFFSNAGLFPLHCSQVCLCYSFGSIRNK